MFLPVSGRAVSRAGSPPSPTRPSSPAPGSAASALNSRRAAEPITLSTAAPVWVLGLLLLALAMEKPLSDEMIEVASGKVEVAEY
jgi:hypothetical protein